MRLSICFIGLLLLPCLAGADIYRCTGDRGEPAFSERPCRESSTLVRRQDAADASRGEGLRPTERAWLAARERGTDPATVRSPAAASRPPSKKASQARRTYQCERRRQALDAVRAELRRGYRPARGERLRRGRRAHETYLSAFCP